MESFLNSLNSLGLLLRFLDVNKIFYLFMEVQLLIVIADGVQLSNYTKAFEYYVKKLFLNLMLNRPLVFRTDFNILDEEGNYDHWKYSTEYWEKLSHWPYLPNQATAHFDVKAYPKNHTYIIHSTHKTCLFLGIYCCK